MFEFFIQVVEDFLHALFLKLLLPFDALVLLKDNAPG
jgi:hypothetical protein